MLLFERRFWPLFVAQFLGAMNDNLLKNALVILITYRSMVLFGLGSASLVALASGLFILPFFLFSGSAGQLSDKYPKGAFLRRVKGAEIVFMGIAAVGFVRESPALLLLALFLMGIQAAFFGPGKYSILPELLGGAEGQEDRVLAGNALLEMGTFVAILLGTLGGGVLVAEGQLTVVAVSIVVLAIAGYAASFFIPALPGAAPDLVIAKNPLTPAIDTFRATRQLRPVYLSILGISWFWFLGASFLTLIPTYTKDVLFGSEQVVTLFLSVFCVGIAVGSVLSERMSGRQLELGLVPFGSIGMTLFTLDLGLIGDGGRGNLHQLLGIVEFWRSPGGAHILIDLLGIAIFSGFYTVPLYTMIQERTPKESRSRVVAGNNILNALFMVASAGMLFGFASAGLKAPSIYVVLGLMNAAVALFIYDTIPEFWLRFLIWMLSKVMYRTKLLGSEHIPKTGAVVLVANHVTFVDWMFMAAACPRPARFVMYHAYFKMPVIGRLFRDAKVIPIAPAHEDQDTMEAAFDRIAAELAEGEVVVIFPEGKITKTGEMNPFRTGIERIIARTPVPVIPVALVGLWGSFFSKNQGRLPGRGLRSKVELRVGTPIPPAEVTAPVLAGAVAALGGMNPPPVA
ncbi:MAG: MFS transporter [Myxococcota bacterium]